MINSAVRTLLPDRSSGHTKQGDAEQVHHMHICPNPRSRLDHLVVPRYAHLGKVSWIAPYFSESAGL